MNAHTPYDDLPRTLLRELEEAGVDPRAVFAQVVTALAEDLPGGGEDITSAATIPAATHGRADFAAREAGIVSGLGVAALVFATCSATRPRSPTGCPTGPGSPPETW
jgi:nicotinate-nucleotide pyrophosphorylase (carboxylating)